MQVVLTECLGGPSQFCLSRLRVVNNRSDSQARRSSPLRLGDFAREFDLFRALSRKVPRSMWMVSMPCFGVGDGAGLGRIESSLIKPSGPFRIDRPPRTTTCVSRTRSWRQPLQPLGYLVDDPIGVKQGIDGLDIDFTSSFSIGRPRSLCGPQCAQ